MAQPRYEHFDWSKTVWVPEDWYPCFAGNRAEIRVSCTVLNGQMNGWNVTVSGADDTAMNRFYARDAGASALRMAAAICDGITRHELLELGFNY